MASFHACVGLLALLSIFFLACSTAQPQQPTPNISATVSAEIESRLEAIPSPEAAPTYTPYPTHTPYPTPTAPPTPTPPPTNTPSPTDTPSPTSTPYPTPTPEPTATPVPTPTHEPSGWESTGNWHRDLAYEAALSVALEEIGFKDKPAVATLDAIPTGWAADLSLSLGCISGIGVTYLTPYAFEVPSSVDTYIIGMWNDKTGAWVVADAEEYRNPVITDDGWAIYITNNVQVRRIIGLLHTANQNRNPDLVLNAGMFNSQNEDETGLWGEFDPAGLQDALRYLPCF